MDNPKTETNNTWNAMAQLYQDKFMSLNLYNDTYDTFLNYLPTTSPHVLDVGCGPGNISHYLLSKNQKLDLIAIDTAENMVTLAKTNLPTAQCLLLDASQINTLNKSFGGIMVGFCLPYLSQTETETFLKDCSNIIEAKGVLYLSFVDGNYNNSTFKSGPDGKRVYFYYHPMSWITSELKKQGFTLQHTFYKKMNPEAPEQHSILIATKTQ